MLDGSEFQVCGAATENARRANSVRVRSPSRNLTGYFVLGRPFRKLKFIS